MPNNLLEDLISLDTTKEKLNFKIDYSISEQVTDMSSYVAVTGIPEANYCGVFGLTPQELRYLQVCGSSYN